MLARIPQDDQCHETRVKSSALRVRAIEFLTAADPLARRQAARLGHVLALVGDGQTLSSLGPAALQHNSAVFRCHSNPEPVGLLTAPRVRLKRTLSLHAVLRMENRPV
jgi:hypothetical protein